MRFFIANNFDVGESVELNAVLLGILVAVLVVLLPQAGRARSILKEARQRVEREVNAIGGGIKFLFIERELWDQYALDTDEQFEDMRLRLEEIVNPERTERAVAEEARSEAAAAATRKAAEDRARLMQAIREATPEEREEGRARMVVKLGNEVTDNIFKESEEEPPRPRPTTPPAPRQGPKLRSSFPLPDSDAERGMILLKIIAAIWAQPPFPCAIRPWAIRNSADLISLQDPPVPVTLPNANAARKWADTTYKKVAGLMSIIYKNQGKVDSLLDAARRADYEIEVPSGPSGGSQIWIDYIEYLEKMKKAWDSLYLGGTSAWKILTTLREELDDQLAAYEANRPRFVQLSSLVAALIGGALIFFAGVIFPLIATQVPRAVYLYLPLAYYFLVLLFIIIASIRYVSP